MVGIDAALTVLNVDKPDRAIVLKYKRTGRLQNSAARQTLSPTMSVPDRFYLRVTMEGKLASDIATTLAVQCVIPPRHVRRWRCRAFSPAVA
jgi:hypothetical protein